MGFTGTASSVVIPAQIDDHDVSEIAVEAFAGLSHITSVETPDHLIYIRERAFYNCANLQSVAFGLSLERVESQAFEDCDIRDIALPDSLTHLGHRAFAGNVNLVHFSTGHGVQHVPRSAVEVASLETVDIGDGVTEIGGFDSWSNPGTGPLTFAAGSNIWRATLGANISNIGYNAFAECVNLEEVNIPASVQVIGSDAFRGTAKLATITIGSGVTQIGSGAFYDSGIQEADLGDALTDIGAWAFQRTEALTSVRFGEALVNIGMGAFAGSSISNAPLTGAIQSIGNDAFNGATSLWHVAIGENVTSIGRNAFRRTLQLESFDVHPDNAHYKVEDGFLLSKDGSVLLQTPLGSGMISNVVPGTVQTINEGSFAFHPTLQSVTIPGSVRTVEDWSFSAMSNLSRIDVEEGLESIGSYAFAWTGVREVNVPASVTSIGAQAFYRTALNSNFYVSAANPAFSSPDGVLFNKDETVLIQYPPGRAGDYTVPGSTTSIGIRAFEGANYLTGVSIPGSVTEIKDSTFLGCKKLTTVIISNGVGQIGISAFRGCDHLTSVTIPASVTQVGSRAFEACTSLRSVLFQGDAPTLVGSTFFHNSPNATIYRLAGASGWPDEGETWAGVTTSAGLPPIDAGTMTADATGVRFNLGWANSPDFVVEAASDLRTPNWVAIDTNTGNVAENVFFDGSAGMHSQRVYRVRWND